MSVELDRLVAFYEQLSPGTLRRIRELYEPEARFKDPFNDVTGHDAIELIFEHMFRQLERPSFLVTDRFQSGEKAGLEWVFSFVASGRAIEVHGSSMLVFANDGRVALHRDYWDPAEELYAKLPWVGGVFRWLRRRMSATAS
jgi:steroid Delta-isomerase